MSIIVLDVNREALYFPNKINIIIRIFCYHKFYIFILLVCEDHFETYCNARMLLREFHSYDIIIFV